jgi:ADP-ribose pyrophosphatase YjhB (NUDIX family)
MGTIKMKFIYKYGYFVCKVYWYFVRPKSFGVKGVLQYKQEVLLIRNSYGPAGWSFPGGGVKKHESLKRAVTREVLEEVGVEIHNPHYIGHYFTAREYKKDLVHCFIAHVKNKSYAIDNSEVAEAQWFPLNDLPHMTSSGALAVKVLNSYNDQ